jgi:hypothetical protein
MVIATRVMKRGVIGRRSRINIGSMGEELFDTFHGTFPACIVKCSMAIFIIIIDCASTIQQKPGGGKLTSTTCIYEKGVGSQSRINIGPMIEHKLLCHVTMSFNTSPTKSIRNIRSIYMGIDNVGEVLFNNIAPTFAIMSSILQTFFLVLSRRHDSSSLVSLFMRESNGSKRAR